MNQIECMTFGISSFCCPESNDAAFILVDDIDQCKATFYCRPHLRNTQHIVHTQSTRKAHQQVSISPAPSPFGVHSLPKERTTSVKGMEPRHQCAKVPFDCMVSANPLPVCVPFHLLYVRWCYYSLVSVSLSLPQIHLLFSLTSACKLPRRQPNLEYENAENPRIELANSTVDDTSILLTASKRLAMNRISTLEERMQSRVTTAIYVVHGYRWHVAGQLLCLVRCRVDYSAVQLRVLHSWAEACRVWHP
jgi:hypothetical protein